NGHKQGLLPMSSQPESRLTGASDGDRTCGSDSVFSASFSGHPFSRLCESSLCSLSCRGHSRSSCRLRSSCYRCTWRGVPFLSSIDMCIRACHCCDTTPKDLTFPQIPLPGIIFSLATLPMILFGHKLSLARKTAFDAVLIVILASVLSRAINGSSAFFATIGGSVVIVLVHRLFAFIAYHSHWFGCLLKGRPEVIVKDGNLILATMRRNHISKHDLEEDLRLDAQMEDASKVKVARVERSGDISFIKKE